MVDTQNMNSFAISFKNNKLSYCGQDCQRIPPSLWNMYGAKVNYLDLSYNNIETLKGLEHFKKLEELILDNNKISDSVTFPHLPYLKTLSLNNNQITDLDGFINKICENFPSLSYLSLLSNKACPNQLSDQEKDDTDYQRYRYYVLYKIQKLRFLDSRRVSSSERREAARRGEFTRVRRGPQPPPPQDTPHHAPPRPLHLDLSAVGKHRADLQNCKPILMGLYIRGCHE